MLARTASPYRGRHKGRKSPERDEDEGSGAGGGPEGREDEGRSVGAGGGPEEASKNSVRKSTWLPLCLLEVFKRVTLSFALCLRNNESRDARVDEDEGREKIERKELLFGVEVETAAVSDDEGGRTSGWL